MVDLDSTTAGPQATEDLDVLGEVILDVAHLVAGQ
jgi:hypothetical protein